jgi:alpha-glucosidase (family GH31 glycosyl hydrolase)
VVRVSNRQQVLEQVLTTSRRRARILVAAPAFLFVCAFVSNASAVTLESAALTLEVNPSPYWYRVVERSTAEVLVRQSATSMTLGGTSYAAANASAVTTTATTLEADLSLPGAAATAHVKFTFTSPQVIEVQLTCSGGAPTEVKEQLDDQQEHYYGVWEYPWGGDLDNRGQDHAFLGVGSNTGSLYTSGRAPFYVTSRRYGIYAQTVAQGHFTIAVAGKTSFRFDGPALRYHVLYGPGFYEVLARYTAIAGGPVLPPLWALDSLYWSDDFHRDLRNTGNAQGNVVDVATKLQANRIHASAILVDRPYGTGTNGWGNLDFDDSFPDPARMVGDLQARGLNLVLWVANRAWNRLYTDGTANSYLFPGSATLGPAADLRDPDAYTWLRAKLDTFAALGAKGYKIDRGEQGEQPDSVQNENVTLFQRLTREGLASRNDAGAPDDVFIISRNVNDTGRQYTAVWNGDSASSFTGLRYSVAAGLRSGALVMPTWGSDTGGYLRSNDAPTEELFARWYGFSAFSPVMEVLVGDGHTPWYHYSSALVDIARKHTDAHHDLIPYTRSFLYAATRTGAPVMRPLAFSFPTDAAVANTADEYLYGSELLVAPVLAAGASSRGVYLPAGKWIDYNDRATLHDGGQSITAAAPLDTIPVFAREGAIVPRGDLWRGNDNWTAGWSPRLRVEVFPSATLGSRFDYYTGSGVQAITASKAHGRMTIQFGELGPPGALEVYVSGFGSVRKNGVALSEPDGYRYDAGKRLLTVPFSGATVLEIDGAVSLFGPGNDDPADAGAEAGVDAAVDAAVDAGASADAEIDAGADVSGSAGADVAVVEVDAGAPDVAVDAAAPDIAVDAPVAEDVHADTSGGADAGSLTADAGSDLGVDAATASGSLDAAAERPVDGGGAIDGSGLTDAAGGGLSGKDGPVSDGAVTRTDAGAPAADAASADGGRATASSGCSCSVGARRAPGALSWLAGLPLLALWARRRRSRTGSRKDQRMTAHPPF